MDLQTFLDKFTFNQDLIGAHGVEREYFLKDGGRLPVPEAVRFLKEIDDPSWTYELSACQVEHRTRPHLTLSDLEVELAKSQGQGQRAAVRLGLQLVSLEVAPADMPLDIYPHDPRYAAIAAKLPVEVLRAANQVAGVHIHRGVRNIDDAIRVHNIVAKHVERFKLLGDHSNGERITLYQRMAKWATPPHYQSPEHFFAIANEQGFAESPKSCYHWVRISPYGTVELRMFGMTDSPAEIIGWVNELERCIEQG